jgi:osmoprotectant transport system ATP-binding protein
MGEFLTVIGSSGCGKTTVLKLINGLIRPDSGRILIHGQDLSEIDLIQLRRNIGYVIQEVGLFPHMMIARNISYVPDLIGKEPKEAIRARTRELIELVGLDPELLTRYPSELSGGQRQRVGLARALAASPDILLMDEPFGAVDEITRKQLQQEIKGIHQKLGVTIFFVTHDIREAMKLGTRVLIMDQGKIMQEGSPSQIRDHPKEGFVQELLESYLDNSCG